MKFTTLVLLLKEDPVQEVLLGLKKIGFGQGKYSGFGGKVIPGETISQAASREMAEETGIHIPPESLFLSAVLVFRFPHKPEWNQDVHLFTARDQGYKPIESNEMIPKWFSTKDLPYDQMWEDGHYWLPRILAGERFQAKFIFKADNERIDWFQFRPI